MAGPIPSALIGQGAPVTYHYDRLARTCLLMAARRCHPDETNKVSRYFLHRYPRSLPTKGHWTCKPGALRQQDALRQLLRKAELVYEHTAKVVKIRLTIVVGRLLQSLSCHDLTNVVVLTSLHHRAATTIRDGPLPDSSVGVDHVDAAENSEQEKRALKLTSVSPLHCKLT